MSEPEEHDDYCLCDTCLQAGLENLRQQGFLQKLFNTKTGEVVWLNAGLPCPPDYIPYVDN